MCVCAHSWLSGILVPLLEAVEYSTLTPPGLRSAVTVLAFCSCYTF